MAGRHGVAEHPPPDDAPVTGISSRRSAASAGVVSETGPCSASSETSPIAISVFPASVSTTSTSPDLVTRAPGSCT
jgi:hypothetical protein